MMLGGLDVTDLGDEVVQLLLRVGIFLGHFLILLLPLFRGLLEGLDFALVVACFDIGLAESDLSLSRELASAIRQGKNKLRI